LGEKVLRSIDVEELYGTGRDMRNVQLFMELMGNFKTLSELLNYFNENEDSDELRQVGLEELNAVLLMTVHKSKGLEFHTEYVYMEGKDKSFRLSGFKDGRVVENLALLSRMDKSYEGIEDYLFTSSSYEKILKILGNDLYSEARQISYEEEMNNTYVALTRPVANLFVYVDANMTKKGELKLNEAMAASLVRAFKLESIEEMVDNFKRIGKLVDYAEKEVETANFKPVISLREISLKEEKEGLIEKDFSMDIDKEFKRKEGLAIHYYLENLTYDTLEHRTMARKLTLFKYGNMLGNSKLAEIFERIDSFVSKEKELFSKNWTVFTEYELLDEDGNMHRIDRLNVDRENNKVLILDYKSGFTKEKAQLDRYVRLIKQHTGNQYSIESRFLEI
jgi:ATP-dependent exoDNAse (exonuclease V) beta subunit